MSSFGKFLKIASGVLLLLAVIFIGRYFWWPLALFTHPLHVAVEKQWVPVVKVLSRTPLIKQSYVSLLGAYGGCSTPTSIAISRSSIEIIDILLDQGGDEWLCSSKPALHLAVSNGRIDVVKHLIIARKFDPNEEASYKPYGIALSEALRTCYLPQTQEIIKILLENGADPNYFEDHAWDPISGYTLSEAANRGCVEVVELLLSHGADPKAVSGGIREYVFRRYDPNVGPSIQQKYQMENHLPVEDYWADKRIAVMLIEEASGKLSDEDKTTNPSSSPEQQPPIHPVHPSP